jgi:hypothetical protein
MEDGISTLELLRELLLIEQIRFDARETVVVLSLGEVRPKARAEVIEHHDRVAAGEQSIGQIGANKPGTAGDHELHGTTLSTHLLRAHRLINRSSGVVGPT